MDVMVFRGFCGRIGELSVAELRALRAALEGLDARVEVRGRIDARGERLRRCLHCGAEGPRPWGQTRTGLKRFRCTACRRTFSSATGTVVARLRLVDKFAAAVADMLSGATPASCRVLAARLGVGRMTIWRWRVRTLEALERIGAPALYGIVEADETFVRESRKGSREWVRHLKSPWKFPEPDRPRWREPHDPGDGPARRADPRSWQVPVLTLTDRAEGRRVDRLPDREGMRIVEVLARHVGHDAVLCSDRAEAYKTFARLRRQPHFRIDASNGPRVIEGAFHIQTVNNLHGRLARFLAPFCGPATRYLQRYLDWFLARLEHAPDKTEATWQRILAT
jgi:transposase-like protein